MLNRNSEFSRELEIVIVVGDWRSAKAVPDNKHDRAKLLLRCV